MKYGFVYIWRDQKHNRYYIGSHWGNVNDSYICSSNWMRDAYRRRPHDFKRRILSTKLPNQKATLEEEQRWLNMIQPHEIKQGKNSRYYNLSLRISPGHWANTTEEAKASRSEKLRKAMTGKKLSEETRNKIRKARLGTKASNETKAKISQAGLGRKHSQEAKNKVSQAASNRSEETRAKISQNTKRLRAEGKVGNGMKGKKHSKESKTKMGSNPPKTYIVTDPHGNTQTITNLRQFCLHNSLHDGHMIAVAKGRYQQYRGWLCSYA